MGDSLDLTQMYVLDHCLTQRLAKLVQQLEAMEADDREHFLVEHDEALADLLHDVDLGLDSGQYYPGEIVGVETADLGNEWPAAHRLVIHGDAFGRVHMYFDLTDEGFSVTDGSIHGLPFDALVGRSVRVRFAPGASGICPKVAEVRGPALY